MKPAAEMTEAEQQAFLQLCIDVSQEIAQCPKYLPAHQRPGILCMFVKGHDRSPRNLVVEYETDPELFVSDAIAQAEDYMRNLLWMIEKGKARGKLPIDQIKEYSRHASTILRTPSYRPVVRLILAQFIAYLREHL